MHLILALNSIPVFVFTAKIIQFSRQMIATSNGQIVVLDISLFLTQASIAQENGHTIKVRIAGS